VQGFLNTLCGETAIAQVELKVCASNKRRRRPAWLWGRRTSSLARQGLVKEA
jgi:hypothetical protein